MCGKKYESVLVRAAGVFERDLVSCVFKSVSEV